MGVGGTSCQRDGIDQAIKQGKREEVLVVWRLYRRGQSLSYLIELIEILRGKEPIPKFISRD